MSKTPLDNVGKRGESTLMGNQKRGITRRQARERIERRDSGLGRPLWVSCLNNAGLLWSVGWRMWRSKSRDESFESGVRLQCVGEMSLDRQAERKV